MPKLRDIDSDSDESDLEDEPTPGVRRTCQAQTRAQRARATAGPGAEAAAGRVEGAPPQAAAAPEPESEDVAALIAQFHNNAEGHHGIHRTVWALQAAGHQWTRMGRDVAEFIEGCVHCQKNRPTAGAPSQERGSLRKCRSTSSAPCRRTRSRTHTS